MTLALTLMLASVAGCGAPKESTVGSTDTQQPSTDTTRTSTAPPASVQQSGTAMATEYGGAAATDTTATETARPAPSATGTH